MAKPLFFLIPRRSKFKKTAMKSSNLFKLHITQEIYVILVIMYEEINGGLIVQLIAKTNIIKRDAKRHKSKVQMYNCIKSKLVY